MNKSMIFYLFLLLFSPFIFSQEGPTFSLSEDCFPGMAEGLKGNQRMLIQGVREIKEIEEFKKIAKQNPDLWDKSKDAFDDQKFFHLEKENKLFWQRASAVDCNNVEELSKIYKDYDDLNQKVMNTYNKSTEKIRMIEPDIDKFSMEKAFNKRCHSKVGFGEKESLHGYKPFQQIGGTCYAAGASALIYAAQKEKVQPSHLDLALNWVINNSKNGMENDPLKSMEGGFTCRTIEASMDGYCPASLVGDEFKGDTDYINKAKKIYETDYLSLVMDEAKDRKRTRKDFKQHFDANVACFYEDPDEYNSLTRDIWKIMKKWNNKYNYKFELVDEISKKMIEPKCRNQDKIKHHISCEDIYPDSNLSSKYDKMADQMFGKLKEGLPLGLSIKSEALYDSFGNHQVTLLGFEFNPESNQCEAIILDSNDPSLGQYKSWISKTKEPQVIKTPITKLLNHINRFQLVKSE